ncbi:MAG: taurine ABC transporter permease [Clostridia bacterium BRH_c25]|nr:MAG: taurine ABC transporter permease [Clostridia bacterium BRH_c25]
MEKKTAKDIIFSILPVVSIAFLFALWVYVSGKNPDFFPTPAMTIERLNDLIKFPVSRISVFGHIWASLQRVLIAFGIAIITGISLGLAMGWNKYVHAFLGPIFEILRPIPPIAWIPLVILWFGVGEFPKILLVFIGSFIPIVLNTFTGVKMVEPIYLNVGKVMKASTLLKLMHIVLPASVPAIFAGLKAALSSGWMVVVAAEMIASRSGVGFLITRGSESYDIALILCGMIIIGIVGAVLSVILTYVERWLCPWRAEQK